MDIWSNMFNFKCKQKLRRSHWQERLKISPKTYFVYCFFCTVNILYIARGKRMEQSISKMFCFASIILVCFYWMQLDFAELALISSELKTSKCQWTLMRQRAWLQEIKERPIENKQPALCSLSYCVGNAVVAEIYEGLISTLKQVFLYNRSCVCTTVIPSNLNGHFIHIIMIAVWFSLLLAYIHAL